MTQKALGNALFSDMAAEWLADAKTKVRPSTSAQYSQRLEKNILPYFENTKLKNINADLVRSFAEYLKAEDLNEKYAYDVMTLLKAIFKYIARTYGYPDPTVGLEMMKTGREHAYAPKENIYDERLYERLQNSLLSEPDLTKCGILITLYTGMKIGELCALKWEDIDLKAQKITISRSIQRVSTDQGSVLMITENEKKVREIPLAKFLCDILKNYEATPERYFLSSSDNPIEPRTMQYRLRAFLKKEYLPDINFNGLRKLFIERCISSGANITVLADILGNCSLQSAAAFCDKPNINSKIGTIKLLTGG